VAAIPERWLAQLELRDEIEALALELLVSAQDDPGRATGVAAPARWRTWPESERAFRETPRTCGRVH